MSMALREPWSDEEDAYLRAHAEWSPELIAWGLGGTRGQDIPNRAQDVSMRAQELGLELGEKDDDPNPPWMRRDELGCLSPLERIKWTPEADSFLFDRQAKPPKVIAYEIGFIDYREVAMRALELGIELGPKKKERGTDAISDN